LFFLVVENCGDLYVRTSVLRASPRVSCILSAFIFFLEKRVYLFSIFWHLANRPPLCVKMCRP
jgi:hypothetical protein